MISNLKGALVMTSLLLSHSAFSQFYLGRTVAQAKTEILNTEHNVTVTKERDETMEMNYLKWQSKTALYRLYFSPAGMSQLLSIEPFSMTHTYALVQKFNKQATPVVERGWSGWRWKINQYTYEIDQRFISSHAPNYRFTITRY